MSIIKQIEQTAISTFVDVIGHGDIFYRVIKEIERTNESMPDSTGEEKRKKVLKDIEIIFDDLLEPIAKSVINLLIELAVAYVSALNPLLEPVADSIGKEIESEIKQSKSTRNN